MDGRVVLLRITTQPAEAAAPKSTPTSETRALAYWLKHPPSAWVDPMLLRTRITFPRLVRIWIIGDRRIISPSLHFFPRVGATVDEKGHDVRSTSFHDNSMTWRKLPQRGLISVNGYGAVNGIAKSNVYLG